MNKILMSLALAATAAAGVSAQNYAEYGISDIDITRPVEQKLKVAMTVDPKNCHLQYTHSATITPVIVAKDGSARKALKSFTLAGKNAYYYMLRDDQTANLYRAGKGDAFHYSQDMDFEPWMNKAQLAMEVKKGCCGDETVALVPMADLDFSAPVFNPTYEYIQPKAVASKLFNLEGQAFINFRVGKSAIDPDYMTNQEELKKILNTINAVRDNKDAKVESISLTGYASPDGSYTTNARLAEARTLALKEYVRKQYAFPENLFITNSVPVDWEGLKAAVKKSGLADADKIIEFLNSDYPVEKRNEQLRKLFPDTYPFLLKNIYPGLRHTDYVVKYEVRKYTDVNEIKKVFKEHPQNLSLNEFFLAAQTYKPGTPEYNDIFDVAVRMYPKDPVANANAAIAAMNRGDLTTAEKFLSRAGNSSDVDYARGLLAAKKGDYDLAEKYLRNCTNPKAKDALAQIENIKNYKGAIQWIAQ